MRTLKRTFTTTLFGALVLSLTGSAGAKDHQSLSDSMIKTLVEHRLIKHDLQRNDNIKVAVKDGQVTLDGSVRSLAEKKKAEREAAGADDVKMVINNLRIDRADTSDQEIAEKIAKQIRRFVFYDIFDWIQIRVDDGVVTLGGFVREPWRRDDYQRLGENVPGVKRVVNEVVDLPAGPTDDRLRVQAARAIYGHPVFRRYADRSRPPIHIVVNRSRITLYGSVASKVELQLAETLVRNSTLAFEVDNQLVLDER